MVWTTTDGEGTNCGPCALTSSFDYCYQNDEPFQTAFFFGLPISCSAGKLRRSTEMDSKGSEAHSANDIVEGYQNSVKPNKASVNGSDYSVTDENRKVMMEDFLNHTQMNFEESGRIFTAVRPIGRALQPARPPRKRKKALGRNHLRRRKVKLLSGKMRGLVVRCIS